MSHEPEKQIEQQLREHAAKRRAEAEQQLGAGLHPVNRKVLQGEVARTYGIKGPSMEKTAKPWWAYWPGLIFAGGLAVVLMVVVLQFSGKDKLGNLAKMESLAPQAAPALAPVPSAPPPAAATPMPTPAAAAAAPMSLASPDIATADKVVEKRNEAQMSATTASAPIADYLNGSKLQPTAKPVPMMKTEAMEMAKADEKVGAKVSADGSRQKVMQEPANPLVRRTAPAKDAVLPAEARDALKSKDMASKPVPVATTSSARSSAPSLKAMPPPAPVELSMKKETTVTKQLSDGARIAAASNGGTLFVNKLGAESEVTQMNREQAPLRRNFQSPPRPAVLNQFELKQSGNTITLIDQDGSVYSGEMGVILDAAKSLDKDAADRKSDLAEKSRASAARTRVGEALGQSFRVIGTNVTLQQPIVVYGEMVPYAVLTNASGGVRGGTFNRAAGSLNESNQPVVPAQMQIQGKVQIGENQEVILDAIPMNK